MATRYQSGPVAANAANNEARELVSGALEALVRQGAREMLARALEEEVDEFSWTGTV